MNILDRMVEDALKDAEQRRIEDSLTQAWYTVREAAIELKTHEETLRRWIRAGKVRVSNPGERKTFIHKTELARLLQQRKQ
jgi:excisionase family DNA binding protein